MDGPQINWLEDGRRLHVNHGPIDLIVEAFGRPDEVRKAYTEAIKRFETILYELTDELPQLRSPARQCVLKGRVARSMLRAVLPHADGFITPMAAVAGAVADEILAAMTAPASLEKAYVNNGGDIALMLGEGEIFRTALADVERLGLTNGMIDLTHGDGIGGIATSGWAGRSFSLGIADAVTVLAATAADADAAATVIANAVRLEASEKVHTLPARQLSPDSDLADLAVTVKVDKLAPGEIETALDGGEMKAQALADAGLISAAVLRLRGRVRMIDPRKPLKEAC